MLAPSDPPGPLTARRAIAAVLCPLALVLLLSPFCEAQEADRSKEEILFMKIPTVISAAGTAQPLSEAPAAISVLSADEIRDSGVTSIPDLFRLVPGVDYARASASNVAIAARGLNNFRSGQARTQVIVDGLPVYQDVLGIIPWHGMPISLGEIDRIEVVQSPATALYGDKAFAGLVNIITKSPDELRGTWARQTAGEAGTTITDLIHAGGTGPVRYKLSAGYDRTNQFSNPPFGRTDDQLGRADARGHAYVEGRIDERSTLALTVGFDQFERQEVSIPSSTGVEVLAGYQGSAQLNYVRDGLRAQVSYNRFEAELRGPEQVRPYAPAANIVQAQASYAKELGASHLLTGGFSYRFLTLDSALYAHGGVTESLGTFYLQDQWSLLRNLTLTAGAGVDVHPEAGVSVSPRAAVVFTPWPDHTFRVSVARAFRDPTPLENFISGPRISNGQLIQIIGNESLKPEEMRDYEVGYRGQVFDRARVWANFFYTQLDDLITTTPVAPRVQGAVNVSGGDAYGVEAGGEVRLTSRLNGFVNYTYLQRTGNADAMGLASNHKANVGLDVRLPWGVSASTTGSYVGVPENRHTGVDAYFLVNLRIAKAFRVAGMAGELTVQVFNLFDDAHREVIDPVLHQLREGDVIGRRVSGSLLVRF